jgi:predicted NBD/HSP70 family sugar kinase
MKRRSNKKQKILVLDVGGSHVKCIATGHERSVKFKSGPRLTPDQMVPKVREITEGWSFDVVSIGYPGVVRRGKIVRDPHNLGPGWVDFDFQAAFGHPVKLINDAAMQAFGGYQGGTMLYLGFGTGMGSALIVDDVIMALELGHLPYVGGHTYEDHVGEKARKRLGNKLWRREVVKVVECFRQALLPDYIVLGGGNATHLNRLPPDTRLGENADALLGGYRLWGGPRE